MHACARTHIHACMHVHAHMHVHICTMCLHVCMCILRYIERHRLTCHHVALRRIHHGELLRLLKLLLLRLCLLLLRAAIAAVAARILPCVKLFPFGCIVAVLVLCRLSCVEYAAATTAAVLVKALSNLRVLTPCSAIQDREGRASARDMQAIV